MNREAQNGLLKTLEEPPDRTVLLLVSSRPHLLLPTVRSRCFSIGFSAMRTSELTTVLEQRGVAAEEAAARAAISGGRLGLALELDLESRHERREEVFQMLESMSAGPAAMERLPAMAAALAGKNEPTLLEGLDLLQEMLRDAARAAPAGDVSALVHADLAPRLTALGERIGAGRAADLVACVERLRNDLRFNTNRQLIAESLLAAVAGARLP
jgi:DNA polymerase-3 subunit delta'